MRRGVRWLRRFELCDVLRRAFVYGCRNGEFRICQFSIQRNHTHLVCEAADNKALSRKAWGLPAYYAAQKRSYASSQAPGRVTVRTVMTPRSSRKTAILQATMASRAAILAVHFCPTDEVLRLDRDGMRAAKRRRMKIPTIPVSDLEIVTGGAARRLLVAREPQRGFNGAIVGGQRFLRWDNSAKNGAIVGGERIDPKLVPWFH